MVSCVPVFGDFDSVVGRELFSSLCWCQLVGIAILGAGK